MQTSLISDLLNLVLRKLDPDFRNFFLTHKFDFRVTTTS
jgi:hypothetical protein